MLKKFIFSSFISFLFASSAHHVLAQKSGGREVDAIKNDISRIYAGTSKQIAVHMKTGAKLKGYVADMESETFILVQPKTGTKTNIRYADVSKVNKTGLSQGQKTALIVGTVGALIAVSVIFRPKPKGGIRCLFCN